MSLQEIAQVGIIIQVILFLVDQSDVAEDIYLVHKILRLAMVLNLFLVLNWLNLFLEES